VLRSLHASILLVLVLFPAASAAQLGWQQVNMPGERDRSVAGCAGNLPPDEFACVIVRCDSPGALGLHFSATGAGLAGNVQLVVDGKSFPVSIPDRGTSPIRDATQAQNVPDGLIEALEAGKMLVIKGAPEAQRRDAVVSLQKAQSAIRSLKQRCTAPKINTSISDEAASIVTKQISEACEQKTGKIDPASVIERDLTGDGKPDLIVHHHGIACEGGGRSMFCGMQACSFQIYVRRGDKLEPAGEFLGVERITVGEGRIPPIRTFGHGGRPFVLRWNGRAFQSR
jgi:hypothetical protein